MVEFRHYTFRLHFTSQQMIALYQGQIRRVSVVSEQGPRIEFEAGHLRPFIGYNGVQGRFRLRTDENHRFIDLTRIG